MSNAVTPANVVTPVVMNAAHAALTNPVANLKSLADLATALNADADSKFGDGRYSSTMREFYKDLQRVVKMERPAAEKLANELGADLGRYLKGTVTVSYGKTDKDGRMTLADATDKCKGIETRSLAIGRFIAAINKANKVCKYLRVTGGTVVELEHDLE